MKWFIETFLKSFDHCQGKRISEKQYTIFEKYLYKKQYIYKEEDRDNALIIEYHLNDLIIIIQQSHAGWGKGWEEYYLTIKKNNYL